MTWGLFSLWYGAWYCDWAWDSRFNSAEVKAHSVTAAADAVGHLLNVIFPESLKSPVISIVSETISPGLVIMLMLMVVVPLLALFTAARAMAVVSVRLSAGLLLVKSRSSVPALTVKVSFLSLLVYWYRTLVYHKNSWKAAAFFCLKCRVQTSLSSTLLLWTQSGWTFLGLAKALFEKNPSLCHFLWWCLFYRFSNVVAISFFVSKDCRS